VQKEGEKKLKCKILCIEIKRMWNLKCKIIPVITGATGILTRGFREKFGSHTRKHLVDSLHKTAYTWNITHKTQSTTV
jgi:hypothetical protein